MVDVSTDGVRVEGVSTAGVSTDASEAPLHGKAFTATATTHVPPTTHSMDTAAMSDPSPTHTSSSKHHHQALHTTNNIAVELQIRTFAMHTRAESGEAAHTAYKGGLDAAQMQHLRAWSEALQQTTGLLCVRPLSGEGGGGGEGGSGGEGMWWRGAARELFRYVGGGGDGGWWV